MVTWGTGIFDNDQSCKWVGLLDCIGDLDDIVYDLGSVLSNTTSPTIPATAAHKALVACEAIARMQGNLGEVMNAQTEILDRLVAKSSRDVPPRLATMAVAAIEFILSEPSEILNEWSTAEDLAAWKNNVEKLKARIRT